jgi:hypothetical protein
MADDEKKDNKTDDKPDFIKGGDEKPDTETHEPDTHTDEHEDETKADESSDTTEASDESPDGGESEYESDPEPEVNDIDADSIIDAFLEENPDLVDVPVEEWPAEAIEMLREAFNDDDVDAPNGVPPSEEDETGEPISEEPEVEEPSEEPDLNGVDEDDEQSDFSEPDEEMDFDVAELSKLVEAGDKDKAWAMLQNMFGVSGAGVQSDTNPLDRMVAKDEGPGNHSNALARIIGGLKF